MEDSNIVKVKLFLDKRSNGIVQPSGGVGTTNWSDYYINIPISKTNKKFDDYINVEKDPFKTYIPRPNFNPYFIELSFFESIKAFSTTGNTYVSVSNPFENVEDKAKLYNITINK